MVLGEQPLLPYEACNLGSINLANMVAKKRDGIELDPTYMEFSAFMIDPVAAMNCIDYDKLKATVRSAVRFLDNVITVNCYPLPEIEEMCLNTRKIGLGVMGFADVCYMLGIRYGSDASINLARRIMKFINDIAIDESEHLAIERGCYPDLIKLGKYNVRPHVSPRRNNTVTTIAPTGTIGIIADASSGIEPIFSLAYYRNAMDDNKFIYINKHVEAFLKSHFAEESVEYLMDLIVKNHGSTKGLADMDDFSIEKVHLLDDRYSLTESNVEDLTNRVLTYLEKVFVSAHDILPEEHIMIQAAFQEYVENAISKTINFTGDATHEDVRKAYILAYEKNCKGVTVYRDGCRDTQVLNNISSGTPKKEEFTEQKSIYPESFYDLPTDLKEKYLYEIMTGTVVGEILCDGCTKGKYPGLDPDQKAAEQLAMAELVSIVPRDRPDEVTGFTKKIQIGCGKLYVTVNHDENGICEVFTNNGKSGGCPSQSEATARLVSIALRAGVDIDEIVRQLRGIRCPSCQRNPNVKVLSCPDAIGRMIEEAARRLKESEAEVSTYKYFKYSDYLSDEIKKCDEGQRSSTSCPPVCADETMEAKEFELLPGTITVKDCKPEVHRLGVCPECGADLAHESGCLSCYECGWSKCN